MMTTMLLVRHKTRLAVNGVLDVLGQTVPEGLSTYACTEYIMLHKRLRVTIEAIQPQQPTLIWRASSCTTVDY
jgi:hypothetical protein